jgi:cytohesin
VVRALADGGADLKATNGDRITATSIAIVNDRFDLARTLLDLGADPNDGALFFAVDMRDATTDMYARDGSRLRANHPNQFTALDLVKLLLERGADPNKSFAGQIHNTSLCCSEQHNASPFFRAAIAADVEVLKLMIKHGAQLDWSPSDLKKKEEDDDAAPGGRGGNIGKTPAMVAMTGGRGAPFAAGPGFERLIAPPYREASNRDPGDALKVLIEAGANPNAKSPDGATLLHQAVTARRTDVIRALVTAGAKLDAVNKENLTPLLLAEKPEPPPPPGNNSDARVWRPRRDSRDEVIATLRDLMKIGPNDPAPVPPPLPPSTAPKASGEDEKKSQATQ